MGSPMRYGADLYERKSFLSIFKDKDDDDGGLTKAEWNAFIGIVTAIVGNVLISFALNLQRYAHIRLNRDKLRRQKSWASTKHRQSAKSSGYGSQLDVANARAGVNSDAPLMDEDDADHQAHYHGNGHNGTTQTTLNGGRRSSVSSASTAHVENGDEIKTQNYLKSGWWWAGIILMVTGEAGNFLAYGFAPASIVSPLGVVALISNCIIAPCLLKERFRQRDFWGVLIAIGGAVTVVLSAENNEAKIGPKKIWGLITRWEFELYLGLTVGAIVVLMWVSGRYGDKSILIDLGLVGLFGGYTVLTTKGVASLLSDKLFLVITYPVTYLLLFILVFTALMQIRYLNRALQRFDSTQVIPTQFVLFTLSVIIGSAVLYRDFESASKERFAKFIGGCALTFIGVYCITSGRKKDNDDEPGDFDGEEGIQLIDEEAQEYSNGVAEDLEATIRPKQGDEVISDADDETSRLLSREHTRTSASLPRTPQRIGSHTSSIASEPFTLRSLDSGLVENPWMSGSEGPVSAAQSQLVLATTSAPLVQAAASSSSSRLVPSDPETPNRAHTVHPVSRTSIDGRRSSLSRRSLSLIPGPLVSPLSSSLSGIVQDNLRRGVDSPSGSDRKKRRGLSRLKPSRLSEALDRPRESEPFLPYSRQDADGAEDGEDAYGGTQKRSRSLSATLGGIFKKLNKSKGDVSGDGDGQGGVYDRNVNGE